jgi:hypothetical protein
MQELASFQQEVKTFAQEAWIAITETLKAVK